MITDTSALIAELTGKNSACHQNRTSCALTVAHLLTLTNRTEWRTMTTKKEKDLNRHPKVWKKADPEGKFRHKIEYQKKGRHPYKREQKRVDYEDEYFGRIPEEYSEDGPL